MDSHGGLDGLSFGGGGSSGSNPEFKVILYKSRSELFEICADFRLAGQFIKFLYFPILGYESRCEHRHSM